MTRPKRIIKALFVSIAIIASGATLFPFYWMLQMSLKTHKESLSFPPTFFFKPQFTAFVSAWNKLGFVSGLLNSVIVSLITLVIALVIGTMAAYALSRYHFAGDKVFFFSILMTRVFPPIGLIIPFFLTLRRIGGYDTYWGLSLSYLAMVTPLVIWMLKGFFDTIPDSLEESAQIDGASRFQAVMLVTLPLVAPGIVATGIFSMALSWNEFLFALVLTGKRVQTLSVVIAEFVGETGIEWPQIMAAAVIALTPVITFTFIVQRHLVQGLTAGAVKG
jgi:ABC-type glycerol-3-phosphate transport system permease component